MSSLVPAESTWHLGQTRSCHLQKATESPAQDEAVLNPISVHWQGTMADVQSKIHTRTIFLYYSAKGILQ